MKSGFEPLHATVVVVSGEAVAFLGESGYGKSSLAASFLDSGHQLLTDDLLILRASAGRVLGPHGSEARGRRPADVGPPIAQQGLQCIDRRIPTQIISENGS